MNVTSLIAAVGDEDRAAVAYAASLAQRSSGSLTGICALSDPTTAYIYATSPYMIGAGATAIQQVQDAQDQLAVDCAEMFKSVCEEVGSLQACHFERREGSPARVAAHAATLSDALVFPATIAARAHPLSDALERVMMQSALPVMLAPTSERPTGTAIIAWDGSAQAARAARFALPVLKLMNRVLVAQNTRDLGDLGANPASAPEALTSWLGISGVAAQPVMFDGGIADGLVALAGEQSAELIVAGAYGSSRAGEFLFGGATRGLLRAGNRPALFLAH